MCCGTEAGSYLRLIDSFITQLKAQGPSRTCDESKEGEEEDNRRGLPGGKLVGWVINQGQHAWSTFGRMYFPALASLLMLAISSIASAFDTRHVLCSTTSILLKSPDPPLKVSRFPSDEAQPEGVRDAPLQQRNQRLTFHN